MTPYINIRSDSGCWYFNSLIRSNPSNPLWRVYELYVQRCSLWRLNQYQCSTSVVVWQAISTSQNEFIPQNTSPPPRSTFIGARNCSEMSGFEIDRTWPRSMPNIIAVLPDWLSAYHRNSKFSNSNILQFRMILLFLIGLVSGFYLPGLAPVSYCPKGTW